MQAASTDHRPRGNPVLLLPGFAAPSVSLYPLERSLRDRLGRPVLSVDVDGPVARCLRPIEVTAAQTLAFLDRLARAWRFDYVDIVGHSMGGLVAAYLLAQLDRGSRVRRVVALGTPFGGSPLAAIAARLLGRLSVPVAEMAPGSHFLAELAELSVPSSSEILSVAGLADTIVPPAMACLASGPGRRSTTLPGVDHFGLVLAASAFGVVAGTLARRIDAPERRLAVEPRFVTRPLAA